MTAELRGELVGAHDHRHRVPADDRAQPALDQRVARQRLIERRRDRVDVGRGQRRDRAAARVLGALDYAGEQVAGAVESVVLDDCVDRVEPLARLDSVDVGAGAV